ncbi:MAG: DUF3352 domain-containing protein [Leptolyngbyaceae cyanobacterium]
MKSRTFLTAIAFVSGLIFLAGIAGFWGLTSQNPRALLTKGGQAVPAAAQFVPRQAPIMVSLLARPDRLWQLRQMLTSPSERFQARQEWQSLQTALKDSMGWNYDTDVRPWLGQEIAIAVTAIDLDHDGTNGEQTGYLAVLGCQDGQKAREAIHLLWQKRAVSGKKLVFETVSGIPLIYDQTPVNTTFKMPEQPSASPLALASLASAVVSNRYVLLANHPQVLRQAIATFQAPDISLAKEATYRASVASLPANRIGWLYANAPSLFTWLGLEGRGEVMPLANDGRRAHHLFMSFRATPSGLLGDTAIAAASGTVFSADDAAQQPPTKALKLMPAATRFVLSGNNLPQLLSEAAEDVGGYEAVQQSLDVFWSSLDLPETASGILGESVQGEYALGMVAGKTSGWVLAAQTVADKPLGTIDELAQQEGLNVSHVRLGDSDITVWTRLSLWLTEPNGIANLETQVVGVHTAINNYQVFSTSLPALQQALRLEDNGSPLSEQPLFTQLIDQLDPSYNSLAYLDWPYLAPSLMRRFPWLRALEQAGKPLTDHLGPIFTVGYGGDSSLQRGLVAIDLS